MAKFNLRSKRTWKKILSIGLGILLTVGAVIGISALVRKSEETTKEINPKYAIGGLTEQGAYLDTKASIYTENAFECQGLDIEMDFKNNVSYRVFFYDDDNEFLSSTQKQTGNYDETTTPLLAKYARIVITPNDDDKISWYEKNGYANQLSIEVNKEQNYIYTDDLAVVDTTMSGKYWNITNSQLTASEREEYTSLDFVDVSSAKQVVLFVPNESVAKQHMAIWADEDKVTSLGTIALQNQIPVVDGYYSIYTFEVPDNATYFVVNAIMSNASNYHIYLV